MCKITCCDCKETSLRGALIFVASMSLLLGVIFVILTLNILTSTPWYINILHNIHFNILY